MRLVTLTAVLGALMAIVAIIAIATGPTPVQGAGCVTPTECR